MKVKKVFTILRKKWAKIKKWQKILIILILITIFILVRLKINKQKKYEANREVVSVVREDLKKEVIRSGQIELQGVVEVTPPISGVIIEFLVRNGQQVKKDQLLFKIKSTASKAEIDRAKASYLSAKTVYENDKLTTGVDEWNQFEAAKKAMMAIEEELRIFEETYPEKKTADNKEYQQLKINESMARRSLEAAVLLPSQINEKLMVNKANYQSALSAYNASLDGSYYSPIDGRIENVGINEGENVIANVGDKKGTPLFLIVPNGRKTISMQIGPNDAMVLSEGQNAIVKTDYVKDATFSAQVVRIDKVGKNVEGKGLRYRAWLEVDDYQNQLLLGIPVEISIITAESSNTLVLPLEAVHDDLVTVVKEDFSSNNYYEERAVTLGIKTGGKVEIVEGLQEDEKVLVDRNVISNAKK